MHSFLLLSLLLSPPDNKAPTVIEPAKLERKDPVDYIKEVAPILQAKCSGCHSGWMAQGGFYTSSAESIAKGGKKGNGIVPGKPAESNVYLLLSHQKKPVMPPRSENDDLTPQQVAVIKLWIEEGAKAPKIETKVMRSVTLSLPAASLRPVRALTITGTTLAAGRGNQVRLFDAKTGIELGSLVDDNLKTQDGKPANAAHVSIVESLAFSPDGKLLVSGSFRELTIWNVETKKLLIRIGGFADKVTAIAWSPKGDHFATAGGAPTEDGEIRFFETAGKHLADIRSPHSDTVYGIAFSPDGKFLASAGADKFVRVFEPSSGKLLKSFEGHTQHVLDVGWTPDGKRIISAGADDLIKIWDYEKGERVRDLKGTAKQVTRLAFAKSANFVSAGGDGVVRRWSSDTGDPGRTFESAKDCLHAVAISADGAFVAAGGDEGIVRLYDAKTGQLIKAVAFDSK